MKRRRVNSRPENVVIQRSMKRPIDKQLININITATDASQTAPVLYTATFPGTIVGLRWDLSCINLLNTNAYRIWWAIVIAGEGVGASTMATSNGATLYAPEQHCLTFGCSYIEPRDATRGPAIKHWTGSTKAMRKLSAADKLYFICLSDGTDAIGVQGIFQFFIKS